MGVKELKKKTGWALWLAVLAVLICVSAAAAGFSGIFLPEPPEDLVAEPPAEEQGKKPTAESRIPEEVPITDPILMEPDPEKPMVALTFDDGPGPYTDRLLDLLAECGGKATFFMVGGNIDSYPDTVRRAAEEGHELASHSWSHPQLSKLGKTALLEEMTLTREKIRETAGVDAGLLRPPYGAVNNTVKAVAAEQGIALVTWSVDPMDWKSRNAEKVYNAVLNTVQDGAIILCHDIHESTVDAMERLLPALQEAGYQLVTVTELLTSQGTEIVPGTLYWSRPAPSAKTEKTDADIGPQASAATAPDAELEVPAAQPELDLPVELPPQTEPAAPADVPAAETETADGTAVPPETELPVSDETQGKVPPVPEEDGADDTPPAAGTEE